MGKNKQGLYILIALFAVYAALHFVNLDKRIVFGWDQEQFSTQIRDIVLHHNFTLLGPRVNNDMGFFLAPYFTYLLIPFYLVTALHPSALIGLVVVVNILFFFGSYYVLNKLFGTTHALVFLAVWTLNPMLQMYDSMPWWPLLVPLGVVVVWALLFAIYEQPKKIFRWVGLGVTLGFFTNMHFQFVFVVLFSALMLIPLVLGKKKYIVQALGAKLGFIAMFTPLLLFDIRHKFLNTTLFVNYFFKGSGHGKGDYVGWIDVLNHVVAPYSASSNRYVLLSLFVVFIVCSAVLYKKTKGSQRYFFLSSAFLFAATPLVFAAYKQRPSEYYFMYLVPYFLIVAIFIILRSNIRTLSLIALVLLFLGNSDALYKNTRIYPGGLYYKDQVAAKIYSLLHGKKFNIAYDGPPSADTGFAYLLSWHGVHQTGDTKDPLIQVRQPPKKGDYAYGIFGIKIPPDLSVNK